MVENSVLSKLPCQLPTSIIGDDIDLQKLGRQFETRLGALSLNDFCTDALWRDVFALTGSIRTFYGNKQIFDTWTKLTTSRGVGNFQLGPVPSMIMRISETSAWAEIWYSFTTTQSPPTTGQAILSLVPSTDGQWQVWLLRTILDQLEGYPNVDTLDPECERVQQDELLYSSADEQTNGHYFDCVVVGGGQAGLSVAGRLKALKLSYVVLEVNSKIGDNWKQRYESMKLHTTRDCAHLPFDTTFPSSEYPKYLSKYDMVKGYTKWVEKYGINIWLWTKLHSGNWNSKTQQWKLNVTDAVGLHRRSIRAKHVVMAIGAGGQKPKMPTYPGADGFGGTIMHSGQFWSAAGWKGKRAVVIGSGTTAHDLAEDMVRSGCSSVTLVQRSPTFVFPRETFSKAQDMTWNNDIPTKVADMSHLSLPHPVLRLLSNQAIHEDIRAHPEAYDALEKAGFRLNRYGDIIYQLFEHFGKFYMDVGAVAMITNGSIKMKSDARPIRFGRRCLVFDNGSELDADLVVFATGFESDARTFVRDFFGPSSAEQMEGFWGLDSEAELRGMYRPCGHPNLWFNGGSVYQARFFSRFIAQQIRADIDKTPLNVYRD